jgi:hypothetical protein
MVKVNVIKSEVLLEKLSLLNSRCFYLVKVMNAFKSESLWFTILGKHGKWDV